MDELFSDKKNFNEDISNWDVSNVVSMVKMFHNAKLFNNGEQPLIWPGKTKRVINMEKMFAQTKFNQPIYMDTSNVTSMKGMFLGNRSFNQNISAFDVSKVTDMSLMFQGASAFNNGDETNHKSKSIEWDTTALTNVSNMFQNANKFNQDITFNGNNLKDTKNMFIRAIKFNGKISINTSK